MTERDEFDQIVQGLSLDLNFPDPEPEPEPEAEPEVHHEREVTPEVPFYRQVDSAPLVPRRRGPILAWCGLVGAPMLLVMATVLGKILPRPTLAAAVIIFVAAAIYLFSQLPEHGPSRSDWPDDGAVL